MSEMTATPDGHARGIRVQDSELMALSDAMLTNILDGYIPLPGVEMKEQLLTIAACTNCLSNDFEDAVYWERESGAHGWACRNCGRVIQYG
jgi:hypothetical protein